MTRSPEIRASVLQEMGTVEQVLEKKNSIVFGHVVALLCARDLSENTSSSLSRMVFVSDCSMAKAVLLYTHLSVSIFLPFFLASITEPDTYT